MSELFSSPSCWDDEGTTSSSASGMVTPYPPVFELELHLKAAMRATDDDAEDRTSP